MDTVSRTLGGGSWYLNTIDWPSRGAGYEINLEVCNTNSGVMAEPFQVPSNLDVPARRNQSTGQRSGGGGSKSWEVERV